MDDEKAIERVIEALAYRFDSMELLLDALTHRSFANERPNIARSDNERLEFLGDSVLSTVVSGHLFEYFPEAPEGELTRRRADLVCESTLAEVAIALGIGPALRLGRGEEKSGGREKSRLLASALEACIGAIFLDGGFSAARAFVNRAVGSRIDSEAPGAHDFKSRLQELTQGRGLGTPTYEVNATEGPDHKRLFHVGIILGGKELAVGSGRSKLEAEQKAAKEAFEVLCE